MKTTEMAILITAGKDGLKKWQLVSDYDGNIRAEIALFTNHTTHFVFEFTWLARLNDGELVLDNSYKHSIELSACGPQGASGVVEHPDGGISFEANGNYYMLLPPRHASNLKLKRSRLV